MLSLRRVWAMDIYAVTNVIVTWYLERNEVHFRLPIYFSRLWHGCIYRCVSYLSGKTINFLDQVVWAASTIRLIEQVCTYSVSWFIAGEYTIWCMFYHGKGVKCRSTMYSAIERSISLSPAACFQITCRFLAASVHFTTLFLHCDSKHSITR